MTELKTSPLLRLPAELLQHVLSFLPPVSLADVSRTCSLLHTHTQHDSLWAAFVQASIPGKDLRKPPPGQSFKHMYLAHVPYWFLPRNKIWFSDSPHYGKLLVARYSVARRCIEAYTLAAERGHLDLEFWSHNPEVIIHTFAPKVQLNLDQVEIRINTASSRNFPSDAHRFQREIMMDIHRGPEGAAARFSKLVLSRPLPPAAMTSQTQVWPPMKLPAAERTRNQSTDCFQSSGHRPMRLSEISEHTFRIRQWVQFASYGPGISMHMGEDVHTYATLPPECYTPTPTKPWRGIWVGDYAGHGCEFLAILQPDDPVTLPQDVMDIMARTRRSSRVSEDSSGSWHTALSSLVAEDGSVDFLDPEAASTEWAGLLPQEQQNSLLTALEHAHPQEEQNTLLAAPEHAQQLGAHNALEGMSEPSASSSATLAVSKERLPTDEKQCSGQLFAVKLTGDPNVPRGEYTFIAPDIGPEGTVRIAEEDIFKGARVIRSCGHIASTGFIDDLYIPSQLILISENKIAQFWEAFGHISFYQRVDIDKFTQCD